MIHNDIVCTQAELRAPDLAAALTAHPKLTQLDFRWSTWLRGHLSCLEPLSGTASAQRRTQPGMPALGANFGPQLVERSDIEQ